MNSTVKYLIITISAIVVLVVTILILQNTGNDKPGNESGTTTTTTAVVEQTVPLTSFSEKDIVSVSVNKSLESFDFTKHTKIVTDSEGNETEDEYYLIDKYDELSQDSSYLYTIPNNLCSVSGTLVVDKADDLSLYGLDEANAIEVTLRTASDEKTLIVGAVSPIASLSYVKLTDSDAIYTIESSDVYNCRKNLLQFFSTIVKPMPADKKYPKLFDVCVTRKDLDYDINFQYDVTSDYDELVHGNMASHIMVEPIYAYLDVNNSIKYTHGVFGLTATEVYKLYPSDSDYAAVGLDDPFCTYTAEAEDGTVYKIKFSEVFERDGQKLYYGCLEGVSEIFIFSESNAPWVNMKVADVTSTMVLGTYVYDVGELIVESSVGRLDFVGSGDKDTYSVTLNGQAIEKEMYQTFYQFLLKTPGDDIYMGDYDESDFICSYSIHLQNDYNGLISDEIISFYATDDRNAVICHNGVPSYTCRISYVNALLSNISAVLRGEMPVLTY